MLSAVFRGPAAPRGPGKLVLGSGGGELLRIQQKKKLPMRVRNRNTKEDIKTPLDEDGSVSKTQQSLGSVLTGIGVSLLGVVWAGGALDLGSIPFLRAGVSIQFAALCRPENSSSEDAPDNPLHDKQDGHRDCGSTCAGGWARMLVFFFRAERRGGRVVEDGAGVRFGSLEPEATRAVAPAAVLGGVFTTGPGTSAVFSAGFSASLS